MKKTLAVMAAALALSTAALSAQEAPVARAAASHEVVTQVRVTNHNWLDARIYLDDDGVLTPLGFVLSQQTAVLTIPDHAVSSASRLRVVALPLGSTSAYVSPDLMLVRGDAVLVTLENQLGLSSVSMRASAD